MPSERRDSGTTLSRVRGSVMIPALLVSGSIGGRLIVAESCDSSWTGLGKEGSNRLSHGSISLWNCNFALPDLPPASNALCDICMRLVKPTPSLVEYFLLRENGSVGPAGAGKTTFCNSILTHLQTIKRVGHLFNLDPAADPAEREHQPAINIRDLITLEDAMKELGFGPNGGLVYCFE